MPKLENTFYWDRAKGQGGGGMTPEQIAQLNKATSDIANHQQEYNDLVRQVEEVNNETSTNTNDIASIETELNDLTNHITNLETNKLDKSVFNSSVIEINEKLKKDREDIIFLHNSIDDKQDKLVAGNNITINGNTISASTGGVGGIRFYEGQSLFFTTKSQAEKFIAKNNLIYGDDYTLTASGKYIITGEGGYYGGSNYIRVENLPTDTFNVQIRGDNSNSQSIFKNPVTFKRSSDDGRYDETYDLPFKLNSRTQTEFNPSYVERYEITILKDI